MQLDKYFEDVNDDIYSLCHLNDNNFVAGTYGGSLYVINNFVKSSEVKKAHSKSIFSLCHLVKNGIFISGS